MPHHAFNYRKKASPNPLYGLGKSTLEAYYSAVSIERSVRDIFDDGEDEFSRLKDDAWHGINTTYWKDYDDGYARLNAVLEKDLHIFDGADVEAQIAQATAALQETQRKIDRALAESQKILSSILDAEERAAECDVLLTRYHRLATQYKADIQRLSLIVEGEEAYHEVPQSTKCPYCEGTITPRKRISYIASSKDEMERTMAQLSGLENTEKDVEDRKKEIRAELEELKRQRDALESKIKTEFRPQENVQQNTVNAHKSYLRIASETALIESYATDFGNDLTALENEL